MPLIIGIPQLMLNLFVITCIVVIVKDCSIGHKAAFIFIANLAVADTVIAMIEFGSSYLDTYFNNPIQSDLEIDMIMGLSEEQEENKVAREYCCRIQVGLWVFGILLTMTCTFVITFDR